MGVSGLRTSTALFLVLLLLPAAILAWLGWRASEPLVEQLRIAAGEEVEQVAHATATGLQGRIAELGAAQRDRTRDLAALVGEQLPFRQPGHLLASLEAQALGGAVRVVGADGRQLLPAGPGDLALSHLAEWPAFCRWRERIARPNADAPAALAAAHAFVAPGLRALAVAEVATLSPAAATGLLTAMPWQALASAGPRPIEVLAGTPAGQEKLAAGWREGWLAAVPALETARTRWWHAAAAPSDAVRCQRLREVAAAGGAVVRTCAPIGRTAVLELLAAPTELLAALHLDRRVGACDVEAELAAQPAALPAATPGVARATVVSEWGPIVVTAIHRGLAAIEAGARRQRWLTGLGILLLLASIGLGTALVRRALLQEQRARALRDDFIANVSHELKTPLTSVRLYTAMLADPQLAPETRVHHGAIAEAEAARLSALVENLLDFAALERGTRRLEPEPVDLAAAVRSVAAAWHAPAASHGMAIECHAVGEVLALVDPMALQRVLTNLLQNACRHGRPARDGGASRIDLVAGPGPAIEVRDNGPGVAVADRQRIFERFERARTGGDGTGLGLALSRDLAIACGGNLICTDDGGETVFRLSLVPVPSIEGSA